MEALTGWAAKDEWDFEYLGTTNNPFIKANYPHHGKRRYSAVDLWANIYSFPLSSINSQKAFGAGEVSTLNKVSCVVVDASTTW